MPYNQWERRHGRPALTYAIRLVLIFGLSLDWIYLGNLAAVPHGLASEIAARILPPDSSDGWSYLNSNPLIVCSGNLSEITKRRTRQRRAGRSCLRLYGDQNGISSSRSSTGVRTRVGVVEPRVAGSSS